MYNKLYQDGQLIDLHIHTQYSDGMYSVPELLGYAQKRGLEVISFTDHDVLDANFEVRDMGANKNFNGKVINGCEIAVTFNGKKYEILAYDFDLDQLYKWDNLKQEYQNSLEEKRIEMLKETGERLGFKYTPGLKFNPKLRSAHKTFFNDLAKYPQNLERYKQLGINKADNFYRDHVVKPGALFYCSDIMEKTPSIQTACKKVHEAGGVVSFAHAFKVYNEQNPKKLIKELNSLNILDGFECVHKKFTKENCLWLSKFCDKHNLLKTGGSDFHGDGFKIDSRRFAPEYLGYVQNANIEILFPLKK